MHKVGNGEVKVSDRTREVDLYWVRPLFHLVRYCLHWLVVTFQGYFPTLPRARDWILDLLHAKNLHYPLSYGHSPNLVPWMQCGRWLRKTWNTPQLELSGHFYLTSICQTQFPIYKMGTWSCGWWCVWSFRTELATIANRLLVLIDL